MCINALPSPSDSIDDDEFQSKNFFNAEEEVSGRSNTNIVACPRDYKCKKLHGENKNVCCPQPNIGRSNKQTEPLDYDEAQMEQEINSERQQTSEFVSIYDREIVSNLNYLQCASTCGISRTVWREQRRA